MPEKRGKLNMIWNEGVKELVGQKELSFEENERQVKDQNEWKTIMYRGDYIL